MQLSAMQRGIPFTTQRPQPSIQRGVVHGQSCGCTASFKCSIHSRQLCGCNGAFKCQTHAKQACGCSRDFKCHAHALSSPISSCGCSGAFKCQPHGRQLCGCSGSFKCHAHGKQSCGCSGSFKCHAHAKQSCGCSGAFKCQTHSSQACGCRGALLCKAHATEQFSCTEVKQTSRRDVLNIAGMIGSAILLSQEKAVMAAGQPQPEPKRLCEADCQAKLADIQEVKTASGLRYKDLIVGKGPSPPTGYQIVADYVAMTPDGKVFDSSLDRGRPYDLRVGSGQIVPGLDEGVASMRPGGLRRIYVPGNLSFPKGLPSGPGRPRVPPATPVMFDVKLLFIPGLEDEEE